MGDEEYVVNLYVAPIADDLLFGCDFLDEHMLLSMQGVVWKSEESG